MVARCAVVFGLLGLFQATLGPLIPLLSDRDGLDTATAGLIVTGFFGGSLVSTAVGGWARGPFPLVCAVLFASGGGALALPLSWPFPLAAVVVAGFGFGGLVLVVNTAMAARGLTHVNLVNGIFGLGAAAGPALVSITHGGYLFAVLAVGVVAALPLRMDLPARPTQRLTASPALLLFCCLLFCYAGVETGLASWEATNLRAHGYAPDTAAALTSLFWLGLASGRLLVPMVTRTWAKARILVTTFLAGTAALALIAFSTSAPAGFFVLGMFAGPVFPTTLAWIAATLPHPQRVNAVVLTVGMLGNATMPAVIGYGMRATSDLALPLFVAVGLLCCLGVVVTLRSQVSQQ